MGSHLLTCSSHMQALALNKPEELEGLSVEEDIDATPIAKPSHKPRVSIAGKPVESSTGSQAMAVPPISSKTGNIDKATDIRLNLPSDGGSTPNVSHPTFVPDVTNSPIASPEGTTQFTPHTRCIVWGMQQRAVQGMLDFDYLCKRARPSVAAIIFPFAGNHYMKFWFGQQEVMLPVYASQEEAFRKHPDVTVLVNFASFRSVYNVTMEAFQLAAPMSSETSPTQAQLRTVAIIAEGVPERHSRLLIREAEKRNVMIIGPATVGGITPGCFRIGNTGGMIDNVIASKLYRPGSVAYVSKSGGMSNELNNLLARYTDGVAEGVAIGGDRFAGSRFLDHILRYEDNPRVKMIVLLGEVGGIDEYAVAEAIKSKRITKPVVAWCIGTCAKVFPFEVQFGHAGALANSEAQTADAKNNALRDAGAIVPANFNDFARQIKKTYDSLVETGAIVPTPDGPTPSLPMDFAWARSLGLVRKPAAFVSSISDDRGEELLYAGVPISKVFEEDLGIGGVLSLLWFRYVVLHMTFGLLFHTLTDQVFFSFFQSPLASLCLQIH